MTFSWSERERLKDQGFQAAMDQMAQREIEVSQKEKIAAKRSLNLDVREERINTGNEVHDELEVVKNQAKMDLANASFELDKARFEMTKEQVANDVLQLNKKLEQKDTEWQIKMDTALSAQSVKNNELSIKLFDRVSLAESSAQAKDLIIASKDEEIARLDQLLKVTMTKLTQIDLKGLTVHVDPITVAHKE